MCMNFYARMRNGQKMKHQEKGGHRINSFNTRDEYYYYYYYYYVHNNLQKYEEVCEWNIKTY